MWFFAASFEESLFISHDSVKRLWNMKYRFHISLNHRKALLIQFHVTDGVTDLFVQFSNKTFRLSSKDVADCKKYDDSIMMSKVTFCALRSHASSVSSDQKLPSLSSGALTLGRARVTPRFPPALQPELYLTPDQLPP